LSWQVEERGVYRVTQVFDVVCDEGMPEAAWLMFPALPTHPPLQRVLSAEPAPQPVRTALGSLEAHDGIRSFRLRFQGPGAQRLVAETTVTVAEAALHRFDGRQDTITSAQPASLDHWLRPTPYMESDAPEVAAAARFVAGRSSPWRRARRLYQYVVNSMWYPTDEGGRPVGNPQPMGALHAMKCIGRYRAKGGARPPDRAMINECFNGCDCTEFACLFVAMARAVGLPARVVSGQVNYIGQWLSHDWAHVWLDASWVPVDLNYAKSTGQDTFGCLPGIYIALHTGLVANRLRLRYRGSRPQLLVQSRVLVSRCSRAN